MRDAADLAAKIGFHRNYEAVITDGNYLVLNSRAGGPHNCFQRFSQPPALGADLATQTCQFRRSRIVDIAAGQQFLIDLFSGREQSWRQTLDDSPKRRDKLFLGL